MNYTLHQLQVFAKVVQLKSITKASEELYMTQPAVSIQLKNFQDQFDIPLTEVVGRQLYVTEFGMEVYKMAERVINEVYAINYKTMAYKGHLTGRLVISIVSTGKYVMPYFLSDFMKINKGVDLIMDVTNKSRVISSLQNNEIDFALNPFSRLDSARNQNQKGVGLGLSIARDIARSHGGELLLSKSQMGGLKASLRLPLLS